MWHEIENINCRATGEMSADCRLSANSKWFLGHFPGKPILPGIAQLAMVKEIIEKGVQPPKNENRKDGIRFSRVKFKKMITPGEQLSILVSPKKAADIYSFRITVGTAVACSGNVAITTIRPNEK